MTLFLAIWGAVLGTLTFLWNLLKWHHEKPQIIAAVQAVESFWTENSFAGIRLTLRNRGGKKTTVEEIFLYQQPRWFEFGLFGVLLRLRRQAAWRHNVSVSNAKTAKLPAVLDVNEVWEGFIPLEANEPDNADEMRQIDINRPIAESLKSGNLRYSIQCSHTSQRLRGLVRNEDDSLAV